ncbi:MAG: hypoxanthine phosphoribosyltransferase [Verrucomicrobia bacterium]|nr:hypoxanthine phosphoribosyltransferase [Verrucomicrobiota bacterium]
MPPQAQNHRLNVSHVLVSTERIQQRVDELARQISRDYATVGEPLLVGVLRGAFIFLADLTRRLSVSHTVDFMALSSYDGRRNLGEVRLVMDLREPVQGRHLLLVEDIIDSGRTLEYLHRILQTRQPASIRTCVLVRKSRSGGDVPVDYLGFELPDVWLVGYGLDYADRHRTLPHIAELRAETVPP